jgi:N-succinyldiaminopimelate aminotransferase
MPRHPEVAPNIAAMAGSVYTDLAHRLATFEGEIYPFHVGDTWMEPAVGCRMQDLTVEEYPGMHRYAAPQGMDALIDGIAERIEARLGVPTSRDNVLVAAGATGALGAVAGAILDPGDEMPAISPVLAGANHLRAGGVAAE